MQNEITTKKSNVLDILRLMQLASSNLPVGGYTFSQGLEYAIESGWLKKEEEVREWIEQVVIATLTFSDLPLIQRQYQCVQQQDWEQSKSWNDVALAVRETHELQLSDTAMGEALLRLTKGLNITLPDYCYQKNKLSFTTLFSLVASQLQLSLQDACAAYCWTVIENQVLAATKLLPLGQTAAQLMLLQLSETVQDLVEQAKAVGDSQIGLSLPGLAMASAMHETQYTRLYRS